ncbi:40S ribosomal protein SA [Tupaia chinensis]|uniref:40S ribosomal protein SA n=1 Tax=Tupaia chinensis TaxID=246437 RepID=L9L401_TUPCH|nr:40S ribosomal protein SA [Tupaia chinensis]
MSGALDVLQMEEEDVLKFLAAGTHVGGANLDFQMEQYVYERKSDVISIINLKRTWENLQVPSVPTQQFPTDDWSAQPAAEDWSAVPTAQATEQVGTTTEWS